MGSGSCRKYVCISDRFWDKRLLFWKTDTIDFIFDSELKIKYIWGPKNITIQFEAGSFLWFFTIGGQI